MWQCTLGTKSIDSGPRYGQPGAHAYQLSGSAPNCVVLPRTVWVGRLAMPGWIKFQRARVSESKARRRGQEWVAHNRKERKAADRGRRLVFWNWGLWGNTLNCKREGLSFLVRRQDLTLQTLLEHTRYATGPQVLAQPTPRWKYHSGLGTQHTDRQQHLQKQE